MYAFLAGSDSGAFGRDGTEIRSDAVFALASSSSSAALTLKTLKKRK